MELRPQAGLWTFGNRGAGHGRDSIAERMNMTRLIATLFAVVLMCTVGLGSDKGKDQAKPPAPPKRVVLSADQVKLVKQIEDQLKELEREYRQQRAVINAQGAGILQVIAQQGGLGDKKYKLVPEGDGFVLEEVIE